ncbi:MAG TPA: TetR/AcrR family transcriptional regulator [Fodinibius sp.]|nr:TetR/AcrR family transcriptional regulator [Fodinibius sp.]
MIESKKRDLKCQIIDAARELLLSEGYRNLSLRKIARSIGVSATSIYLHFDNKDNLVHALIDEAIEALNMRLEESVQSVSNPISQLKHLAYAYVQFALQHPRQYQIIYLVSSDEMARYPKEKFRKARKGYKTVRNVLLEGKEAGLMKDHKPDIAAYTFWAQMHGVMSVVLSRRLDAQIDQHEFIDEAIEHIIGGYQSENVTEAVRIKK